MASFKPVESTPIKADVEGNTTDVELSGCKTDLSCVGSNGSIGEDNLRGEDRRNEEK